MESAARRIDRFLKTAGLEGCDPEIFGLELALLFLLLEDSTPEVEVGRFERNFSMADIQSLASFRVSALKSHNRFRV